MTSHLSAYKCSHYLPVYRPDRIARVCQPFCWAPPMCRSNPRSHIRADTRAHPSAATTPSGHVPVPIPFHLDRPEWFCSRPCKICVRLLRPTQNSHLLLPPPTPSMQMNAKSSSFCVVTKYKKGIAKNETREKEKQTSKKNEITFLAKLTAPHTRQWNVLLNLLCLEFLGGIFSRVSLRSPSISAQSLNRSVAK